MSATLYTILLLQVKGKAGDNIKTITNGEGCKAWQKFEEDYDPKVRTKRVGMLIAILNACLTGDLSQALDQFERMISDFERSYPEKVKCPK